MRYAQRSAAYFLPSLVPQGAFLAREPAIALPARILHSLGGAVGRSIFVCPLARRHVGFVLGQEAGPVVRDEQDGVQNVLHLSK